MNLSTIQALIAAMAQSDLTELTFSEGGWTLRLARGSAQAAHPPAQPSVLPAPSVPPVAGAESKRTNLLEAPLAGIVYLQPAPDAPPFVEPGSTVQPGDPVCVIEAMKVLNTVRAEHEGTVAEILVVSGSDVEAGQPLLRLA